MAKFQILVTWDETPLPNTLQSTPEEVDNYVEPLVQSMAHGISLLLEPAAVGRMTVEVLRDGKVIGS